MIDLGELIVDLTILGLYPPLHPGGGTVTNVGTSTGLTGGPITSTGVISFADINAGLILANITGISAPPLPNTLTAILDDILGTTQGSLIYRNATVWTTLAPGTAGYLLQTGGASANPSWVSGSSFTPFAYQNAYWVSQATGSDTNSGTSIEEPLATYQKAITLASMIPTVIYGVDGNQNNTETIATLGTGQTIIIQAPGTSFQGSITQTSGDAIFLNANYVDSFVSNSTSSTYLTGGQVIVTSTASSAIYANVAQYTGAHTGGGFVFVNCNFLNGLTTDNTITAFIDAPLAQNITNAGALNIWTTSTPASCIVANTGTINGIVGGVAFGGMGITVNTGAAAVYNFPLVDATIPGQAMLSNAAGSLYWGSGSGYTPFAYINTLWVSQANGNDSNLGTSIETPLLTVQAAITLAAQTPTLIYVVDVGYTNSETLATLGVTSGLGSILWIVAPGTILNGSFTTQVFDTLVNVTALGFNTITNNAIGVGAYQFICGGAGITGTFTDNGACTIQTLGTIGTYAGTPQGTIINCGTVEGGTVTGGSGLNVTATSVIGNFTFVSMPSLFLSAPTISSCAFNTATTAIIYANSETGNTNDGTSLVNGILGNAILSGFSGPTALGGDLTFGNSSGVTYTQTSAAPTGANQVLLSVGTSAPFTTTWGSSSGYTPFAYQNAFWVSQANGSDLNAGTSIEAPLATYAQALTLLGANAGVIYGVDANQSNTESLEIIQNSIVSLEAPGTVFAGSILIDIGGYLLGNALAFTNVTLAQYGTASLTALGGIVGVTLQGTNSFYANSNTINNITSTGTGSTIRLLGSQILDCNFGAGDLVYVTAAFATFITNAATLNITAAQFTSVTNTGTINGIAGNIAFGGLGVAATSDAGPEYTFTASPPTGANQVLLSSGAGPGATTSWGAAGGYTPFAYLQTFWVSQLNGSDSNLGTSIETPFQTVQNAITTADTTPTLIYVVDAFTSNSEIIATLGTGQTLYIQAPATTFAGTSVTVASSDSVTFNVYAITNLFLNSANCNIEAPLISNLTQTGGITYANILQIPGAVVCSSAAQLYLTTTSAVGITLNTTSLLFLQTVYNAIITNDGTSYVNGVLGSTTQGLFGNNWIGGTLSIGTGITTGNFYTLPDVDATIPGQALVSNALGVVSWASGSGYTPYAYTNAYWVDDVNGNDSSAGTSIETPFLTYTKAFTVASTTHTIIYGINANNNNTENITTLATGQNVWLQAPGTTFAGTFTTAGNDIVNVVADQFSNVVMSGNSKLIGSISSLTLAISGNALLSTNGPGPYVITATGGGVIASSESTTSTYTNMGSTGTAVLEGNWYSITTGATLEASGQSITNLTILAGGAAYVDFSEVTVINNAGVLKANIAYVIGSVTNTGLITGYINSPPYTSMYGALQQDKQISTGFGGSFFTAIINVTPTNLTLALAAQVNVLVASFGIEKYQITNIFLNRGGVDFSGGGDRDLALTDGTTVYTVIPAATLQALSALNAQWGGSDVPFPASAPINRYTVSGANLYLQYSGGAVDYAAGSVTLSVEYARVG